MPISAKPRKDRTEAEVDVESLISRGGSVPEGGGLPEDQAIEKPKNVQLRLLPSKIAEIDALCAQRRVRISRHYWFMEAIEEKLEREQERAGSLGST